VYADDTLLIDSDPALVQELMRCIEECGGHYGLQFNWGKLELMKVKTEADETPRGPHPSQAAIHISRDVSCCGRAHRHRTESENWGGQK